MYGLEGSCLGPHTLKNQSHLCMGWKGHSITCVWAGGVLPRPVYVEESQRRCFGSCTKDTHVSEPGEVHMGRARRGAAAPRHTRDNMQEKHAEKTHDPGHLMPVPADDRGRPDWRAQSLLLYIA